MYCRETRSENTGSRATAALGTPGEIITICSRTTRMGTSIPHGVKRSRVHTPVATTTLPAATSVPSASRTPVARSPSSSRSVIAVPEAGGLPPEKGLGPPKAPEPEGGPRGQGAHAVVAGADAGGLALHPRPDGAALDDEDVGAPPPGQGPGRRGTLDATADDD